MKVVCINDMTVSGKKIRGLTKDKVYYVKHIMTGNVEGEHLIHFVAG